MKKLLSVLLLLSCLCGRAANPSYQSFSTNDFVWTNGGFILVNTNRVALVGSAGYFVRSGTNVILITNGHLVTVSADVSKLLVTNVAAAAAQAATNGITSSYPFFQTNALSGGVTNGNAGNDLHITGTVFDNYTTNKRSMSVDNSAIVLGDGNGTGLASFAGGLATISSLGEIAGIGVGLTALNASQLTSGILPPARLSLSSGQLATALTDETGSGAAVFAANPLLNQPAISDFTSAQHTHTGASSGGVLTIASIASPGTIVTQTFTFVVRGSNNFTLDAAHQLSLSNAVVNSLLALEGDNTVSNINLSSDFTFSANTLKLSSTATNIANILAPGNILTNGESVATSFGAPVTLGSTTVTNGFSVTNAATKGFIFATNDSLSISNGSLGLEARITNGIFLAQIGSTSRPGFAFGADPGTGMYNPFGSQLWFAAGSGVAGRFTAGGIGLPNTKVLFYNDTSFSTVQAGLYAANSGIVEVNNGTTANYRDLLARNVIATNTGSFSNGIIGYVAGSSAASGIVGEVISSLVASGSAVSLTTATAANVTSISLTAGDWDVSGNISFAGGTATYTGSAGSIGTTSATLATDGTEVNSGAQFTAVSVTDGLTVPAKQINVSATTTVYLIGKATFSAGTVSAYGSIRARRVR